MIKLEVLAADEVTRNLPLVVDLDGTLNPTDTLVESRIALATKSPLMLFRVPLWMIKGRARFKECVAAHAGITGTSRWKGLKTITPHTTPIAPATRLSPRPAANPSNTPRSAAVLPAKPLFLRRRRGQCP